MFFSMLAASCRTSVPIRLVFLLALASNLAQADDFIAFESAPVRPFAVSSSGGVLYVVNTPDNQLEAFQIDASGTLHYAWSLQVGMEPVAVAVDPAGLVWVTNHLSDSVSIIDVSGMWVLPGLIDTHTHLLDSGSLYTSPDDYDLTARSGK